MLDVDAVIEQVAKKSTVIARVGRYVGAQDGQALVDMGDQRFPAAFVSGLVPQINEAVRVWSIDGVMFMMGPTAPKPGVGVILTVTGSNVSVRTDFGDFQMPIAPSAATPTSGDTVGISWSSQPWCTLIVDVPDPEAAPPSPGGGAAVVQTAEFRAVDAGSTDRGLPRWWQSQPWASESTFGAWFYGSQIKDTIPAGATFVSLEFYVSWVQRYGGAPRFALHNQAGKGPVPGFAAFTEWAPGGGYQTPPDAVGWFDALKSGGAWSGIGLNQGGYNKFSSLAQDGMSGALRIKWKA